MFDKNCRQIGYGFAISRQLRVLYLKHFDPEPEVEVRISARMLDDS